MALTKDDIIGALRAVPAAGLGGAGGGDLVSSGVYQWSAVCDTFVSVKLGVDRGTAADALTAMTARVERAIAEAAARAGSGGAAVIDSLIVEYVDDGGSTIATHRRGRGLAATQADAAAKTTAAVGEGGGHRPIRIAGAGAGSGTGSGGGATAAPTPQQGAGSLPGVSRIIAVGAGKGGVGKSSIAINLAVGLARRGHSVGVMDGDIYGPSFPTMLGLDALEQQVHGGKLQPFAVHGVKAVTIGKLVSPDKPLIWRGPMAHGAFKQLTDQTEWGELDYLIIDLPPGTGDISLTMAQTLRLTGAVVVCTPQKVAQDDAVRAARMFQQLGIEVLGVVENMSYFVGDDGKEYDIFGRGGAQVMAQRLGAPFLGAVPITMALRKNSDLGDPTANFTGTSESERLLARSLEDLASNLESQAALAAMRLGQTRPTLTIS